MFLIRLLRARWSLGGAGSSRTGFSCLHGASPLSERRHRVRTARKGDDKIALGSSAAPQLDLLSQAPLAAVVVSLVWQWTPFMMLILLAGLQSRPMDTVEAAQMDGATPWAIFRHLTLPHLRQYLELGGLLGAIYIVQNFDSVFTLTAGGLGTANLPYAIYQTFYYANEYGLASAAGVVVVIGTIIVATFALRTVFSLFKKEAAR